MLKNGKLFLFENIEPISKHHWLWILIEYIKDINSLTEEHIQMLKQMKDIVWLRLILMKKLLKKIFY